MKASILRAGQSFPAGLNAFVWLSAFFSPTAYFLLLVLAGRFQIQMPPPIFVATLFCLIPAAALWFCEAVIWRAAMRVASRITWMLFTLLAMLLQIGVMVVIVHAILITRIAYPQ